MTEDFSETKKPCVGCGYCCHAEPCGPAAQLKAWDKTRKCRFLRWNGLRYVCGLYLADPAKWGPRLIVGEGCGCANYNPWYGNVRKRPKGMAANGCSAFFRVDRGEDWPDNLNPDSSDSLIS